jgi:hypothetical protein
VRAPNNDKEVFIVFYRQIELSKDESDLFKKVLYKVVLTQYRISRSMASICTRRSILARV